MKLKKKLKCILLIDDDPDDNTYHRIVLEELDVTECIDVAVNGIEALAYLKRQDRPPEIIFLDINMPRMNGWEFLDKYKNLPAHQKAHSVILMLTTSANPDDMRKAREIEEVTGFHTKPLTVELMTEILENHFQDHLAN